MAHVISRTISELIYQGIRMFPLSSAGTRILCYHRVDDKEDAYTAVTVSNFKDQMKFLFDAGYKTIGLSELLNGQSGPKNIVITFDDGTRDIYDNAFSILREFGFRATVFCIGRKVGESGYLGPKEIQDMRQSGFEFGSHTLTHSHLKVLERGTKFNEITGSKKMLEDLLGFGIDFFCYPFGEYDQEAVELVRAAGYLGACSNIPGSNNGKKGNPLLLKRTEIGRADTLRDFRRKLAGAYDLLHQTLHWMRGRP